MVKNCNFYSYFKLRVCFPKIEFLSISLNFTSLNFKHKKATVWLISTLKVYVNGNYCHKKRNCHQAVILFEKIELILMLWVKILSFFAKILTFQKSDPKFKCL
jgi:hypothetical protein